MLSKNDNGQHVEINVEDVIEITLHESPTTGYQWEIAELNEVDIQVISEDFNLNPEVAIGAGGTKIIRLKVKKKGTGRIRLENRRSWNGEVAEHFEISY